MTTADECRAKANEAEEFARQALDLGSMRVWEGVVEDWLVLEKLAAESDAHVLASTKSDSI